MVGIASSMRGRTHLYWLVYWAMAFAPLRRLAISSWRKVWRLRSATNADWVALIADCEGRVLLVRTPAGLRLPRQHVVKNEPVVSEVQNYISTLLPQAEPAPARLLAIEGRAAHRFEMIYSISVDPNAGAIVPRNTTWTPRGRAMQILDDNDRRCLSLDAIAS